MPSAAAPCASSVPSVRKPEPHSGTLMPAAAYSLTNCTAPPPAKNEPTTSTPETGQLREQRLEVGLRERQRQVRQHLAAALLECLLEAAAALGAGGIVPRHPYALLVALLGRGHAHAVGRLPVGERGAEHVLGAQIARDGDVAGVGNDRQRTALGHHLVDAHLHARVHRADQHIDLVALDQAVCVLRTHSRAWIRRRA